MHEIFSFGMWVRRRRKALDLTQAALAQRVGCAEVTIRKLETDVFRPSREMAERYDEKDRFSRVTKKGHTRPRTSFDKLCRM